MADKDTKTADKDSKGEATPESKSKAKSVLYITTPGALAHQNHGRLRITKGKELLQEVRLCDIERVVIIGGTAGLTSTAATALMESGIECAFLSSNGIFRGFLAPAKGRGASLRLAQFTVYNTPERRLEIARKIVARKIKNSDIMIARYARNHPEFDAQKEQDRLFSAQYATTHATSVESLMGFEGEAAAAYFSVFGRMLGGGFRFSERSRRPPRDPANALLSFGYTLLTSEATNAVAGAGLDPAIGMLHSMTEGRPSLALDLMEPFRTAVVDRLILNIANNRLLSPLDDFTSDIDNGPRLSDPARRKFLLAYEERMTEPFTKGRLEKSTSLRECLRQEAHSLARAFRDDTSFRPFALP
jgi:CRISP-associated protein Cas1